MFGFVIDSSILISGRHMLCFDDANKLFDAQKTLLNQGEAQSKSRYRNFVSIFFDFFRLFSIFFMSFQFKHIFVINKLLFQRKQQQQPRDGCG